MVKKRGSRVFAKFRAKQGMNRKTITKNKYKRKGHAMKKKAAKKGWYFKPSIDGGFYTHTPNKKATYHLLGTGKEKPTPKQIYERLQENPDLEMDMYGSLMVEYDTADTGEVEVGLPSGFYRHQPASGYSGQPEKLVPITLREDLTLELADTYHSVMSDIESFLAGEHIYREIGIQYRRGLLLYGPPGNGKTTVIRRLLTTKMPKDAIVIWLEAIPSPEMLKKLGDIEGNRLKVFVFEELVAVVENLKMERLLDFLDGERSVDKSLVIATTNYPERLPFNIVDRPSRFDKLYKIGSPSASARRSLLKLYLSRNEITQEEVDLTKDYSIAAIKEACLYSRLKSVDLSESIKMLKDHKQKVKTEFADEKKAKIGFSVASMAESLLEDEG